MPIQHALWKVGEKPTQLPLICLDSEKQLEDMIVADQRILSDQWMLIGRQVCTSYGKYIDLLAIDPAGTLIIIELKKNKTPREVVAQAIDYASWVQDLETDDIADIYKKFQPNGDLQQDFKSFFDDSLDEDQLNNKHQMVVVAAELDASTERIVNYLNTTAALPINVLFFSVFQDGAETYISRSWLLDPEESSLNDTTARKQGDKEPWNGEFYCSYGHKDNGDRRWEDAQKYNFISGGGKRWYSKTLFTLSPGDRVWVNIPGTGYVGVATVRETAVKFNEFICDDGTPLKDQKDLLGELSPQKLSDDDDRAEYCVKVDWIVCKDLNDAVKEIGFFGNQNTIAKPNSSKWVHTVNRLKSVWGINE